ncbi:MAG: hypothetical protein D6738_06300 [Acidobacteria bacterium]|nr:MAG: hypothetical protein D6738_06300 [Acidobacteriota bacterium]
MTTIHRPRNRTKAEIRAERRAGIDVIVKDYAARPWPIRAFYGRPTLRREARVYGRLAGVAGIPRCLGLEGRDALVIERVPGRPLSAWRGPLPDGVLDRLAEIVADVHRRGVAIADLHHSNVLVADDGTVHLVDFAIARIARDPARPGPLVRLLMQLDDHAVARLVARHRGLPEPRPTGLFGALYRLGRRLKGRR